MELPEIPRWEGEPEELFGAPPSDEASQEHTPATAYALAHVLNDAGVFDPDFLDSIAL